MSKDDVMSMIKHETVEGAGRREVCCWEGSPAQGGQSWLQGEWGFTKWREGRLSSERVWKGLARFYRGEGGGGMVSGPDIRER